MQAAHAVLTGKIPMLILRSAAPSTAAMIAAGLPQLLDALLLARCGAAQSSAAAAGYPILMMIQTIGFTLGMGAGSSISRSLGKNDRENALRAASTAFFLSVLLAGALCSLGFIWAGPLSRLLGADNQALGDASLYIRYVLLTGPLLCMNLVLSSLLRAQAQTLPYMIAYLIGAAVGCPLQFILIAALNMGVTGSGVAMLVREAVVSTALLPCVFLRGKKLRPRPGLFSLSLPVLSDIMRSGAPTLLRQGTTSLSSALITRTASVFGNSALSGLGLAMRAASLISSAIIGFGQGFQPVCGIAFGANDLKRVHEAYRFCQRFLFAALLAVGAAVFAWTEHVLSVFSPDPQTAAVAAFSLKAQSVTFFAQGAVIMMNMLVQSMGLTGRASLIATSRQGYALIPLVLILPRIFGLPGLLLSQSSSDIVSLLLCFPLTRRVIRSLCALHGYSHARKASP